MDFGQRGAPQITAGCKKHAAPLLGVAPDFVRAIPTRPGNCNSTSPARHCDESHATGGLDIDPRPLRLWFLHDTVQPSGADVYIRPSAPVAPAAGNYSKSISSHPSGAGPDVVQAASRNAVVLGRRRASTVPPRNGRAATRACLLSSVRYAIGVWGGLSRRYCTPELARPHFGSS